MLEKIFKQNEVRFIAIFVISVFIFLGVLFGLAFIVDPYNDFGTNIINPIILTNRTKKLTELKKYDPKPEILVLGSSRMFGVNPEQIENLTGKIAYNASVSWARPEDYWAILNYTVNDLNIKPKMIIIGINLSVFNNDDIDPQTINNNNLNKYLSIDTTYKIKTILKSFKNSINLSYLRDIFIALFRNTNNANTKAAIFLNNGMQAIPEEYTIDTKKIKNTYNRAYSLFKSQKQLDPLRRLYLENTISFSNQNDIKVKLVLLPMPNIILDRLKEETLYSNVYSEFLNYITDLKKAYNFEFYDFSTIDKFDGFAEDFSDATHPGSKNIEKIIELIFQEKNNL